jgi:phosphate starvation-inducible PhoH-like protein
LKELTLSHQLSIHGVDQLTLYGHNDANLLAIEDRYGVRLTARGDFLTVDGPTHKVQHVSSLLEEMVSRMRQGEQVDPLDPAKVKLPHGPDDSGVVLVTKKNLIRPRSETQAAYVESINEFDIVFGVGPAGTGKTYLSVACAVASLKEKEVSRIILTRPAVEAGENLGFLPGDILTCPH